MVIVVSHLGPGSEGRGIGDIREHPPLEGEGDGDDEEHEQCHLRHQQHEHLGAPVSILSYIAALREL